MALPLLNPKTEAFQEKSLKNQTKLNSKVTSGFDKVNSQLGKQTKLLSRVESWLDQTYELHLENYQKEDEWRREQMRALRSQRRASTAAGAAAGTAAGAGGGVGAAAAAAAVAGGAAVTALGKKILDFFKGGKAASKLDDLAKAGSKAGSKLDDVAKAGKNAATKLDDVGKASSKTAKALTTAGDDIAKAASKTASAADDAVKAASKTVKTAGAADDVADALKVGSKADDALRAAKIADAIAPPSAAARIFAKVFPPLAIAESIAVNIKDGYDVATAGLDNDIATEIQKEDVGALVGAGIGAGIGLAFGGPMGAVLGASIGNTIGEYVGNYFDTDFTDDFAEKTQNMNELRKSLETQLALYDEQRKKGLMDEQEYLKEKTRLEQEMSILDVQETERAAVQQLLDNRTARAEEYNKIKAEVDRIEQAGGTASKSLLNMLAEAEGAFKKADKSFDDRAKAFSNPIKAAEESGIYNASFFDWMGLSSTIDTSRLGELTSEQLQLIAKEGSLSESDMRAVNAELSKRGLETQGGKTKYTAAAQSQAFDDATGLLTGISASQIASRSKSAEPDYASVADAFGGSAVGSAASISAPMSVNTDSKGQFKDMNDFLMGLYPMAVEASKELGGVDPNVLLTQWGFESGWGKKTTGKFNYFGIKADPSWNGAAETVMTHEYIGGKKVNMNQRFRSYNSAAEAVRDYVSFLKGNQRYTKAGLFRAKTPQEYLGALQSAGYATDPNYASNIMDQVKRTARRTAKFAGGGIGPSPSGSVSGGSSGNAINATSTAQGAAGGAPIIVDNSSTVVDNSTNASSTTTNAMSPTPRRSKDTGVRGDMVLGF